MQSLLIFHISREYLTLTLKCLVKYYVCFMAWMLLGKPIIGKLLLLLHLPKSSSLAARNISQWKWSCAMLWKYFFCPLTYANYFLHFLSPLNIPSLIKYIMWIMISNISCLICGMQSRHFPRHFNSELLSTWECCILSFLCTGLLCFDFFLFCNFIILIFSMESCWKWLCVSSNNKTIVINE